MKPTQMEWLMEKWAATVSVTGSKKKTKFNLFMVLIYPAKNSTDQLAKQLWYVTGHYLNYLFFNSLRLSFIVLCQPTAHKNSPNLLKWCLRLLCGHEVSVFKQILTEMPSLLRQSISYIYPVWMTLCGGGFWTNATNVSTDCVFLVIKEKIIYLLLREI